MAIKDKYYSKYRGGASSSTAVDDDDFLDDRNASRLAHPELISLITYAAALCSVGV